VVTEMPSYRRNAIAAGVLFIVCTVATILSALPTSGLLDGSDYLAKLAAHDNRVVFGALIEFVWALSCAGIAIALYPALRKFNRALALGSVAGRMIEGTLVLIGALSMLVLLSVGQDSLAAGSAGASSFLPVGDALLSVRDWLFGFVAMVPFALGVAMYYYVLYRSRLVPRWLSGWGLVAAALSLASTIYSGLAQDFGFSTVNIVLSIPIAIQEMVLAVWLIAKGFNRSALAAG
jgi:hypothetical protein